jgi:hypothetical protein
MNGHVNLFLLESSIASTMCIPLRGERPPVSIWCDNRLDLVLVLTHLVLETNYPSIANASRYVTLLMEDIALVETQMFP